MSIPAASDSPIKHFSNAKNRVLCNSEDKCIQVNLLNEVQLNNVLDINIDDLLKSDRHLAVLTSIPSYAFLSTIEECILNLSVENNKLMLNLLNGLPINYKIMMAFMKLKQNIDFIVLAIFFKISTSYCIKFFYEIIPFIKTALKSAI